MSDVSISSGRFRDFAVFGCIPGMPFAQNLGYTYIVAYQVRWASLPELPYVSATFRSHPRQRRAVSEGRAGARAVPKHTTTAPKSHDKGPPEADRDPSLSTTNAVPHAPLPTAPPPIHSPSPPLPLLPMLPQLAPNHSRDDHAIQHATK